MTATCDEFHGTTFRSAGNILCIKRAIKSIPVWMFTAKCGAIQIHTRVYKLPIRMWKEISLSTFDDHLVDLHNYGIFS